MNQIERITERLSDPSPEYSLYTYFEPGKPDADDTEILRFINICKRSGVFYVIPHLCETSENDKTVLEAMRSTYRHLLAAARDAGIQIAFNLEKIIETTVVCEAEDSGIALRAQFIDRRQYYCNQKKTETIKLHVGGKRLAIVAVNFDYEKLIDLRDFVKDDQLIWDVPSGNWTVEEYFCSEDTGAEVNYLDYASCMNYLERAYTLFADIFEEYHDALGILHTADICFHAPNRRNWDVKFNEVFRARYGFDPAPYYPHLYSRIDQDTPNIKALLFCCRAEMLQSGIFRALADFSEKHGLKLLSTLTEPKLSASSWITGDAILDNSHSPGALLDRSYLYGVNSLKIAAAGAYNFDRPCVSCELYRDYYKISLPIIYKDAINAFGRGANLVMAHTEHFHHVSAELNEDIAQTYWLDQFSSFVSRSQTLLRGGRHIADIAVLYPIHSLHSHVNFYSARTQGFEYPSTPANNDYVSLINSIAFYAGHDITLLHPSVLAERCHIEGDTLCLDNANNPERFRILVLPAADLVRLDTLLRVREFYEAGGKLIITGDLPTRAFEWTPEESHNAELRENLLAIFGEDALNPTILQNIYHVKNEKGGEAILLYQSETATDGTMMVNCVTLSQVIDSFCLPFDITLPTMPRFICTGALNNPYPEFKKLGLHRAVPGGGMLNHIHKRRDDLGLDIFFFGNTTDSSFCGDALLRGDYILSEYNPHTNSIHPLTSTKVTKNDTVYTKISLSISSVEAKFILGTKRA